MVVPFLYRNFKKLLVFTLTGILFLSSISFTSFAANDLEAQMEERKTLPIQSNEYTNWPKGPAIGAQSAILMEMNTHTILYEKNINQRLYPASTTKILTSLLAVENCELNETVTFSYNAVHDVEKGASGMGMDTGEELTMEDALYGVLVASANEAASAVGEHVAQKLGLEPTADAFASLMNKKAAELGCTNSHFVNANGLFNENHYTSAYDLALIGCEFFKNDLLCQMSSTPTYHIPVSPKQPDDIWIHSKNQLYKGRQNEYPYLLGSKTGYVEQARQTLVSAAEKDGLKLVCVVFMEESPYQFTDTISLFEYGFSNFQKLSVSDHEENYSMNQNEIFSSGTDLFGNSTPFISLDSNAYVIVPRNTDFSDLTSIIHYEKKDDQNQSLHISYTYYLHPVGDCPIILSDSSNPSTQITSEKSIVINIRYLFLGILFLFILIWIITSLVRLFNSYNFTNKGESKRRRKNRKKELSKRKKEERKNLRNQKKLLRQRRTAYKKRKKAKK